MYIHEYNFDLSAGNAFIAEPFNQANSYNDIPSLSSRCAIYPVRSLGQEKNTLLSVILRAHPSDLIIVAAACITRAVISGNMTIHIYPKRLECSSSSIYTHFHYRAVAFALLLMRPSRAIISKLKKLKSRRYYITSPSGRERR